MSKSGSKNKPGTGSPAKPTKTNPPDIESVDAGNMDKIRDILFGNQIREFERRFNRLEEHISNTLKDMREDTRKSLDTLESFFKEELQELSDRIKEESNQRSQNVQTLTEEIKSSAASLAQKVASTNDTVTERASELRRQLLEQSKQLSSEIQDKYEQSRTELKQTASGLETTKVERSSMAELLIQMAMSLTDAQTGEAKQIHSTD